MPSGIQPGGNFERLTGFGIVGIVGTVGTAVVVADILVEVVVVGVLVAFVPRPVVVVVGHCLVSCSGEGRRI